VLFKRLKNGPLEISGAVKVLDYKGKEYADAGNPVYLCRCANKEQTFLRWQPRSRRLQVRRNSRLRYAVMNEGRIQMPGSTIQSSR
jgi:hypothetical protein